MSQLLILSKHAQRYQELIETKRFSDLSMMAITDPSIAIAQGQRCEIALGEPALLGQVLQRLPALRWVQSTWTGVEPLLDPNLRRDYILTNVRGVFGALMREYVFAYLLAHERRLLQHYATQQSAQWNAIPPGTLRGKQLGLLGVGSIGAELARTAKHFGMIVKGYTRASETCDDVDRYYHGADKLAFAADLDYLVSILPNTSDTRHIVDRALLKALPRHALLVNVGRGSAVDDEALVEALQAGRIAAAVLDVFQTEPLPSEHILWRAPNIFITSHTAAPSFPEDIVGVFIENYRRWARGEPLQYRVDFVRGY